MSFFVFFFKKINLIKTTKMEKPLDQKQQDSVQHVRNSDVEGHFMKSRAQRKLKF